MNHRMLAEAGSMIATAERLSVLVDGLKALSERLASFDAETSDAMDVLHNVEEAKTSAMVCRERLVRAAKSMVSCSL